MTLVMRKFGKPRIATRQLVGIGGNPVAYRFTPVVQNPRLVIDVRPANDALTRSYWDSEYGEWVRDAVNFWQQCVTGLRYTSSTAACRINFAVKNSLQNNVLGIAGPGNGSMFTGMVNIAGINNALGSLRLHDGRFATVSDASMHFSAAHYKLSPANQAERDRKNAFFVTCVHEIWHCLGGGMWNGDYRIVADMGILGRYKLPSFPTALTPAFPHNNVVDGNPRTARYVGGSGSGNNYRRHALDAWRRTMVGRHNDASITIENFGMGTNTTMANAGTTAGGHWKQAYHVTTNSWQTSSWTHAPTGVVDRQGNDMRDEIGTGWSSATRWRHNWVGEFSLGALQDIGYSVNYLPLSIPLHEYRTDIK